MKELKFVIHEHFSKRKHFDFRFQVENDLESYAIPKELPMKDEKRLAVFVGLRPLSVLTFEGTIEEGGYGAGKIVIWDSGNFIFLEDLNNKKVLELNGNKVKGKFAMIKLKDKDNWLIFRKD
ncbi:MAG TPA: DNA polymerase ligase N-terminal domain-containing protein [Candidatus Nanoarchaeia archaeon]|nr:DNA polymerase ligase N-terminal domain-containing protein [Candidatus Nanoarchaeia archaeon]